MGDGMMTDERQDSSHFTLPLGGSRRRNDDDGRAFTFCVRNELTARTTLPSPEARPSQRKGEVDETSELQPSDFFFSPFLPATLVLGDDNWLTGLCIREIH